MARIPPRCPLTSLPCWACVMPLLLLSFASFMVPATANTGSNRISVALSQVEETDSILKTGLSAEYSYYPFVGIALDHWRRSFDPILASHYMLSGYRIFLPDRRFEITGKAGISLLYEYNRIQRPPVPRFEHNINGGVFLGLELGLFRYKNLLGSFFVHSAIFPASIFVILGLTGRKNVIGINLSYQISVPSQTPKMIWEAKLW